MYADANQDHQERTRLHPHRRTFFSFLAATAAVLVLTVGTTGALDFADVKMMVESQVPEDVIIKMAEQQGDFGLTLSEANTLRQAGASENLIAALGVAIPEDTATYTPTPQIGPPNPPAVSTPPAPAAPPPPAASVSGKPADGEPIVPLSVTMSSAYPALYEKQGWLSISNRDWQPYFLIVNESDEKMYLSRNNNGGTVINPGENVVLNIRRNGYKLYGDTGEKLEVKIRENLTTTLSLEPFGVFGNSGLTGVATDRGKIKSQVLFAPYVPVQRVIVEPAPVVIAPPPPAVIVAPPPPTVRYYYGPSRRYYYWYR